MSYKYDPYRDTFTHIDDEEPITSWGTGTTLIGCEQTGRKCFMSELDPKYCDVIIQRWENFTGQKAIKAEG